MARSRTHSAEDDQPTAPFWMATFSDMVTLLLAFFVMIVAMSEVEVKKFEEALSYFKGHTGLLETSDAVLVPTPMVISASEEEAEIRQAERFEDLLERLDEEGLEGAVQVNLTQRGLQISIADSIMFASGEAVLLPHAATALRVVAEAIGPEVKGVAVEGHTDNIPIQTERYPSNWELSAARAAVVVRFFLAQDDALSPDHYQAAGYGEFRPRTSNETSEGRAQNRRVEILLSTAPWQTIPLPQTLRP